MALINVATREIHCKVVYYGAGFCGKTTNLQYIQRTAPGTAPTELLSIATDTDRTLFCDFLPLDLGTVEGFRARFHLYATPGQVIYVKTRQALLAGVDGLVFVADSSKAKLRANVITVHELDNVLRWQNRSLQDVPLVMQYNKRDLPDALPIPVLDARLNPMRSPAIPAVAMSGEGVFATLRTICKLVIAKL